MVSDMSRGNVWILKWVIDRDGAAVPDRMFTTAQLAAPARPLKMMISRDGTEQDITISSLGIPVAKRDIAVRSPQSLSVMLEDQSSARRMAVLEIFEVVECLLAIKQLDVPRLRGRESSHRPAQMNEVRLDRRIHRMHPDLVRQAVRLASITRAARSHDIGPIVRSTT